MDKLISIVVPVYNAKKYINRCLDSLVNQTYKNTEIILVDDGSKDGSEKVCDSYANKYKNISVLHIENGGPSNARNTGIAAANGEYLMFCDSDDYPEKNWCMEFANAIDKYGDNHFFICGMRHIDNVTKNGEEKLVLYNPNEEYTQLAFDSIMDIDEKWLLNELYIKIFKTSVIKQNELKMDCNLSISEDIIFILEYLKCTQDDFLMLNKPLYNYIQDNSQSLWFKYHSDMIAITEKEKNAYTNLLNERNITDNNTMQKLDRWLYWSIYHCLYNAYKNLNKENSIKDFNQILSNETVKIFIKKDSVHLSPRYEKAVFSLSGKKVYAYFQREKFMTRIYNMMHKFWR